MRGCLHGRRERTHRKFTDEFKRDAVELVRTSGRPVAQVAAELGIYDPTLGSWVKQDRIDRGEREGLTTDERARLRELEREDFGAGSPTVVLSGSVRTSCGARM